MALQVAAAVQAAMLDAAETAIGASPVLELRTGALPAALTDADGGTLIASIALPADFMADASGNSKAKQGTWEDPSAEATGVVGHFRLKQGPTAMLGGTVTAAGGGGDMTMPSTSVTAGEPVLVDSLTWQFG